VTSTLVGVFFFITFWAYRKHQLERLEQEVIEKQDEILMAVTAFRSLLNLETYTSKDDYANWRSSWSYLGSLVNQCVKKNVRTSFHKELEELECALENGDSLIKEKNEEYIQLELEKYQDFFDNMYDDYLLSDSQRRAIVTDEKHNLIVAGAGTGKTSTLIGKASYILKKGLAKPHEILLVCFARKARDEIETCMRTSRSIDTISLFCMIAF